MKFYSFFRTVNRNTNQSSNPVDQRTGLSIFSFLCGLIIICLASACTSKNKKEEMPEHSKTVEKPYVVTISSYDFSFTGPQEIPSGWITFKLDNKKSINEHELSIGRIPNNVSYKEYLQEYVGAWAKGLKELQEGTIEASDIDARVEEFLPKWAGQVSYLTSRGIVSPGRVAEKTVYLEPGNYALDCWAKTSEGYIHVSSGMSRPLTVTEESANSPKPTPEESITLHKNEIEMNWSAGTGYHSFALNFDKASNGRPFHSNIHLIKTNENTNLQKVNEWLDWYRVGGLRTPGPADFLGGISTYYSNSDEGSSFFSVTIDEPGQYAWIVHTDETEQLWKTFTIE